MVLEILFNLTKDSNQDKPLVLLATNFFSNSLLSCGMLSLQCISNQGVKHFVDLLRKLCGSSTEENKGIICGWELLLPSATSLVEAGIKFKRGTSESILDIKFIDGVLEIPPIVIQDVTEAIFRNLISYEQCHPKCEDRIISYAVLLDSLINTSKDIDILCDNQIIFNSLNPEVAAQLFNKLYHDTYVKDYYYTGLCMQVNNFCQRRWPRLRAMLVRNYFDTPLAIISTLAATILLIMTFLQTFYTMKN
jgi:hypothetical protein